jgi:YHS domain-containing protein
LWTGYFWLEDGEFKSERALVRDPVCGMEVDPERAPAHATIDGVEYWFCARGCRDEFEAHRRRARTDAPPGGHRVLSETTFRTQRP